MGSTTTDVRLAKKVFLRAMPLRFSLTTEARILAGWRMANEASSVNSALLRTFSLIALFFSREGKGINALDQIYVCPVLIFQIVTSAWRAGWSIPPAKSSGSCYD